jgi:hypothetical protein
MILSQILPPDFLLQRGRKGIGEYIVIRHLIINLCGNPDAKHVFEKMDRQYRAAAFAQAMDQ